MKPAEKHPESEAEGTSEHRDTHMQIATRTGRLFPTVRRQKTTHQTKTVSQKETVNLKKANLKKEANQKGARRKLKQKPHKRRTVSREDLREKRMPTSLERKEEEEAPR